MFLLVPKSDDPLKEQTAKNDRNISKGEEGMDAILSKKSNINTY